MDNKPNTCQPNEAYDLHRQWLTPTKIQIFIRIFKISNITFFHEYKDLFSTSTLEQFVGFVKGSLNKFDLGDT